MLTKVAKKQMKILKKIYENILKMQIKSLKYVNVKSPSY